jgi:hypothetical protein
MNLFTTTATTTVTEDNIETKYTFFRFSNGEGKPYATDHETSPELITVI